MKATGLVAGDGSTPSPVVSVECGEEKIQTNKQKVFPQESIKIKAFDGDKKRVYGSYDCPLKNLIGKRKTDVWFPLLDGVAKKARVLISLEVSDRPPNVIYHGQLHKQGGAHGGWANWQNRWCV